MQYTEIFSAETFFEFFLIFAQNIDCGYSLEPPRRGGSNEYPQSMFWSKNKKNQKVRGQFGPWLIRTRFGPQLWTIQTLANSDLG